MPRTNTIDKRAFEEYLDIFYLSGISTRHLYEVERYLRRYFEYIGYNVDKSKTIAYFKQLKDTLSVASYRKIGYQIRKFLMHLNVIWVEEIHLPADPIYTPKRLTREDIQNILSWFEGHKYYTQIKALILLGATSGLRAEELYQLKLEDIDIKMRAVHVYHDPINKQTTKTKKSRVSFFNKKAQNALSEYLTYFNHDRSLKKLFSQRHFNRLFRNAPIHVKDLRKFFSQEWDRQGGPTSIKKILMGHSLRNDVDLMHYNYQSEEDLKKIYDKVMSDVFLIIPIGSGELTKE